MSDDLLLHRRAHAGTQAASPNDLPSYMPRASRQEIYEHRKYIFGRNIPHKDVLYDRSFNRAATRFGEVRATDVLIRKSVHNLSTTR